MELRQNLRNFFIITGICLLTRIAGACEFYSCVKEVGGVQRHRICKGNRLSPEGDSFQQVCCNNNEIASCVQGEATSQFPHEKVDHLGMKNYEQANMLFISF